MSRAAFSQCSSLGPTAPTPFPSSSSLCTLAPGAGGRGGGWSFTFFRSSPSCRKQHQMTQAGSTAPLPETAGGCAGEFPARRVRVAPTPPPHQRTLRVEAALCQGRATRPSASTSAKRDIECGLGSGANPSLVLAPKFQGCVPHPLLASFFSYLKWGLEALLVRASGMGWGRSEDGTAAPQAPGTDGLRLSSSLHPGNTFLHSPSPVGGNPRLLSRTWFSDWIQDC